jgi:hypothetical protein
MGSLDERFCSEFPTSVFAVSVLRTPARWFGLRLTLRVRVAHCDLGVVLERPWIKCSGARMAISLAAHASFQL